MPDQEPEDSSTEARAPEEVRRLPRPEPEAELAPDPVSERVSRDEEVLTRPEIRWGAGCLVGAAAMLGSIVIVFLVALAIQPPAWVQVVLGVVLIAGAGLLAWLVATALARHR